MYKEMLLVLVIAIAAALASDGDSGVTKPPVTTITVEDCDDDNGNGNGNGNNGSSKNPDDCDDNGNGNGNGNNGSTPQPCSKPVLVLECLSAEEARKVCLRREGTLAVINSREQWKVMTDLLKDNNVEKAWIGGSEINLGGDQEDEECEGETCPALKNTGQISNEDCCEELPHICEARIC